MIYVDPGPVLPWVGLLVFAIWALTTRAGWRVYASLAAGVVVALAGAPFLVAAVVAATVGWVLWTRHSAL